MALTVTNSNTLSLLNILNRTTAEQSNSLLRLSTGKRINKGADDPAGLIAVASLNAELTAVGEAIKNGQRANAVLDVADGALVEVSNLLTEIERLASASTSSGGLSNAEIAANQAQIDSAIISINRIVQTTAFNGKKLLDGQQSIRTTSDATALTDISDIKLFSRPSSQTSFSFSVNVVTAGSVASGTIATNPAAVSAAEFAIAGNLGTATITVASGASLTAIRDQIIATASETGVSAAVNGTDLTIQSRDFGDDAFVSASRISGDADFVDLAHSTGADAVVTVNGQTAFVDGLRVSYSANGNSGEFYLTSTGNAAGSAGTVTVDGGGITFQLGTTASTQSTLGIEGLFAQNLGNSTDGYLNTLKSGGANDVSNNATKAVAIARSALSQLATQRGRVGGFQKFQISSSINSLNATRESLESARSIILDVDFAEETAELARTNVLIQSAISLLGVVSQQSAQVLSLLR